MWPGRLCWPCIVGACASFRYVHYNDDGTIAPVVITGTGVGEYTATAPIQAENYFAAVGVEKRQLGPPGSGFGTPAPTPPPRCRPTPSVSVTKAGGCRVCLRPSWTTGVFRIAAGASLSYPNIRNVPATPRITLLAANGGTTATTLVVLSGAAGPELARVVVQPTGSWDAFENTAAVPLAVEEGWQGPLSLVFSCEVKENAADAGTERLRLDSFSLV